MLWLAFKPGFRTLIKKKPQKKAPEFPGPFSYSM
jgi:hypothetical protein